MAVLVARDLLGLDAAELLARHDEQPAGVAPECIVSAHRGHLGRRRDPDGDSGELAAVHEPAEELGPRLPGHRLGRVGVGDLDADGLACRRRVAPGAPGAGRPRRRLEAAARAQRDGAGGVGTPPWLQPPPPTATSAVAPATTTQCR